MPPHRPRRQRRRPGPRADVHDQLGGKVRAALRELGEDTAAGGERGREAPGDVRARFRRRVPRHARRGVLRGARALLLESGAGGVHAPPLPAGVHVVFVLSRPAPSLPRWPAQIPLHLLRALALVLVLVGGLGHLPLVVQHELAAARGQLHVVLVERWLPLVLEELFETPQRERRQVGRRAAEALGAPTAQRADEGVGAQ